MQLWGSNFAFKAKQLKAQPKMELL